MIYLGRNPVGVAVKQTDEWVRPAEYPDLDVLTMPDYDCVYVTVDLRCDPSLPKMAVYSFSTFERGHIQNNNFVVDETFTYVSEVDLDIQNGVVQLWRIKKESGWGVFRFHNLAGASTFYLNPIVEMRGNFIVCNLFSPSNIGFTLPRAQSIRMNVSRDYDGSYLFAGCRSLRRLIIEGSGKLTNISYMFNNVLDGGTCIDFTKIDLSHCVSARAPFMSNSFFETVDLSKSGLVNAKNIVTQSYFLYDSPKIKNLNLANTDFGVNMFLNNGHLREFTPGKIYERNINLSDAYNLTKSSILRIIDALPVTTQSLTLALHNASKALLSADEIAIATAKGWTIV